MEAQQMNDALKLVNEKLMPAYDEIERQARGFSTISAGKCLPPPKMPSRKHRPTG